MPRILLAEDDLGSQVLLSTYFRKVGARVTAVGDGWLAVEEARAALAAGRPYDVIVMDMAMPVLDGYGATAKLRESGYRGAIVALTAHSMPGDRERCESAGCDGYVAKPVDLASLAATVARFLPEGPTSSGMESTYADDEDMKELVRQFVRDLQETVSGLAHALRASDLEVLRRAAHQLKGSAGLYGFPEITEAAAEVEAGIDCGVDSRTLLDRVEALAGLCRRARAR